MFDFGVGWSELLLVCVVALIVIGPKELPGALRTLGQWMAKIRRMASEFQGQFQEAMREAEVDQLRKDMDDMAAKAKGYTQFDPLEDVRKDIERTISDPPAANQPSAAPEVATAPPAPDTPAVTPPPSTDAVASQSAATPAAPQPDVPPAQAASTAPDATTHTPAQATQPEPALAGGKPDAGRSPA